MLFLFSDWRLNLKSSRISQLSSHNSSTNVLCQNSGVFCHVNVIVEHLDAPSRRGSMHRGLLPKHEFVSNLPRSAHIFELHSRIFLDFRPCSTRHERRPALACAVLRKLCALYDLEVAQLSHSIACIKLDTMAGAATTHYFFVHAVLVTTLSPACQNHRVQPGQFLSRHRVCDSQ